MGNRLQGKRAVVAGVGPGMGSAIAVRLADEGAAVVVVARTMERLATAVEIIRARGGRAEPFTADVADHVQVEKLLAFATETLGGTPDILVNAVGGWKPGPADESNPATVDAMLRLNLATIMTTTPRFAAAMAEVGRGAIVNIGATFGVNFPSRGQAVYNATKAGVASFSASAAADLLDKRVRVNCVLPGGTVHEYTPDRDITSLRKLGKDRVGVPEDIASAVLFLVSDEAGWITGASLTVDGGEALRHG